MGTASAKPQQIISVTADEYMAHDDASDGICLACYQWTTGGCEPDARKYRCEACDEHKVYGAAEALLMGRLSVED